MLNKALMNNGLLNKLRHVPAGAVAYYPALKPDSTYLFDYSGNNNHGTITGATWQLQNGLMRLYFATGNYVTTGATGLGDTDDYTIMFWLGTDHYALVHDGTTRENTYYKNGESTTPFTPVYNLLTNKVEVE
jgi:hypothetical protein